MCGGACPSLAHDEWLAVKHSSVLSNGNNTLTVRIPPSTNGTEGKNVTYLKKSELLSKHLPDSMKQQLHQGQVLNLVSAATEFDELYDLVELAH